MSPKYSLNKEDLLKIAKVAGWTIASSLVGFVISTLPQIDVPTQYAAIVAVFIPVINTGLVALQKFFQGEITK